MRALEDFRDTASVIFLLTGQIDINIENGLRTAIVLKTINVFWDKSNLPFQEAVETSGKAIFQSYKNLFYYKYIALCIRFVTIAFLTPFLKVFSINVVLQSIDLEYGKNLIETFIQADQFLSVFCPDFILFLFTELVPALFNDLPLQLLTDSPQIGPLFKFLFFIFSIPSTAFFYLLSKALNIIFFCLSYLKYLLNPIINIKRFISILAIILFLIATSQLRFYLQSDIQNAENKLVTFFNWSYGWLKYFILKEPVDNIDDFVESLLIVKQTYPDKIMHGRSP